MILLHMSEIKGTLEQTCRSDFLTGTTTSWMSWSDNNAAFESGDSFSSDKVRMVNSLGVTLQFMKSAVIKTAWSPGQSNSMIRNQ